MRFDINAKEALRYIASNSEPYEVKKLGREKLIPERKSIQGTRPGVTAKAIIQPAGDNFSQWVFPGNINTVPDDEWVLDPIVINKILGAC